MILSSRLIKCFVLLGTSILGFTSIFQHSVLAATCTANSSLNQNSSQICTDYSLSTATVTIQNAGKIGGSTSSVNAITTFGGTITSLTNTSTGIIGGPVNGITADYGIYSYSNIGTLDNSGRIAGGTNGTLGIGGGTINSIINSGVITGGGYAIENYGVINSITNTGTISGSVSKSAIYSDSSPATIGSITNSGTITGGIGIDAYGRIDSIVNTGTISGTGAALSSWGIQVNGSIGSINNSGTISSSNDSGIEFYNRAIGSITNTGSITGGAGQFGISGTGTLTTLTNAQGGNAATASTTALTYTGALPTNYNIVINNATHYGQLAITGGSGNTVFGISALSGAGSAMLRTYQSVFTGVTNTQLGVVGTSATGTSNGYGYRLTERVVTLGSEIWDLTLLSAPIPTPTGPSAADTQQSLVNTSQALQGTFTVINTALTNSLSYDCTEFGANNFCISAGGRNTAVSAANGLNNTSALLIAAYRPHQNYRIGAYADQNLSMNNAGSTVNLGNNTPLIGLFGAWNQRLDGTGTEVKVSAAYGQKNTTVTRQVVGTSEAGSGGAPINSQGAQVTAKYGFGLVENVIVSPYIGVRYTQNNMNGYTEATSSTVTAPLTYSALNTNATTALAGVGASYRFIPQAMVFASAGVESDTNTANGTYSATGVSGLTPINFNANPVRTRPTATVGAYYEIVKNQRLGVTGIYRQEPYQAVQTTTVMATYTIGL